MRDNVSRLAAGSALAVVGALVIVLSQVLGWSEFPRPWSFLVGLAGGLVSGVGCALSVCGLVELRAGRAVRGL
jgi:hypothetical protein